MFVLNPQSGTPIYRQLVEQITRLIAGGSSTAGAVLPSVRELAELHTVNPMTISKAYAIARGRGPARAPTRQADARGGTSPQSGAVDAAPATGSNRRPRSSCWRRANSRSAKRTCSPSSATNGRRTMPEPIVSARDVTKLFGAKDRARRPVRRSVSRRHRRRARRRQDELFPVSVCWPGSAPALPDVVIVTAIELVARSRYAGSAHRGWRRIDWLQLRPLPASNMLGNT